MYRRAIGDSECCVRLSQTFGTEYETEKDRAKRELMEFMSPLITNDEVIVVDPEAEQFSANEI